ncbi:cold-shock DNA-binding protein family [Filimonas lacunae]|uniref:Cold-shock DNA-binding protein family n=1 Tax=Filimonas lacunae TaxID=477680 RepID=A0A173MAG5_9BACT|nr:cold shock domain-containing protein [Filimonas lacunae]BAV04499.1 cold shock protein CspG [Filimonas lacunae]SIT31592.1 cold-shock DNA-binding protein family [Filimonas lacunae]
MGKSQESFNKKEKEKKKQQKLQEKQEKKAERQANSSKGKGLEDMMAYIDENGNITNTPPDPSKRKEISLEDVQISVSRQQETDDVPVIRTGIVTHFNMGKGYGFIRDLQTQESIFVHINDVVGRIQEGSKVNFETTMGHKGPQAIQVKLAV